MKSDIKEKQLLLPIATALDEMPINRLTILLYHTPNQESSLKINFKGHTIKNSKLHVQINLNS